MLPKYLEETLAAPRPSCRPAAIDGLLFHPPYRTAAENGPLQDDWPEKHGTKSRFYMSGLRWLFGVIGASPSQINNKSKDAIQEVRSNTDWATLPNSGTYWSETVSGGLVTRAREGDCISYQKAAMIMVATELFIKDKIERGENQFAISGGHTVTAPEDVYKYVSIVPAFYNIERFGGNVLNGLREKVKDFDRKCYQAIDRLGFHFDDEEEQSTLLDEIVTGGCITWHAAGKIEKLCKKLATDHGIELHPNWKLRAHPGTHLGKKGASRKERPLLNND